MPEGEAATECCYLWIGSFLEAHFDLNLTGVDLNVLYHSFGKTLLIALFSVLRL
jgi:hypothetical protein